MDKIQKINVAWWIKLVATRTNPVKIQQVPGKWGSNVGYQANPVVFFVIVDMSMKDMIVPSIPVFFWSAWVHTGGGLCQSLCPPRTNICH